MLLRAAGGAAPLRDAGGGLRVAVGRVVSGALHAALLDGRLRHGGVPGRAAQPQGAVRATGPRHATRADPAALHPGVDPGAAQAAHHRARRQGQLRTAAQAQEGGWAPTKQKQFKKQKHTEESISSFSIFLLFGKLSGDGCLPYHWSSFHSKMKFSPTHHLQSTN